MKYSSSTITIGTSTTGITTGTSTTAVPCTACITKAAAQQPTSKLLHIDNIHYRDHVATILPKVWPTSTPNTHSCAESRRYFGCPLQDLFVWWYRCVAKHFLHSYFLPWYWYFPHFRKNWTSPEMQMTKKVLMLQNLSTMDLPSILPPDLFEFFQVKSLCWEYSRRFTRTNTCYDVYNLLEYQKMQHAMLIK